MPAQCGGDSDNDSDSRMAWQLLSRLHANRKHSETQRATSTVARFCQPGGDYNNSTPNALCNSVGGDGGGSVVVVSVVGRRNSSAKFVDTTKSLPLPLRRAADEFDDDGEKKVAEKCYAGDFVFVFIFFFRFYKILK